MAEYRLTDAERRLAYLIWQHEPLPSPQLVTLCAEQLGWKKSTTYTMLKRLEEKGLFENRESTVRARIGQEEFYAEQSRQYVSQTFEGSLPRFITAFARGRRLSNRELAELQKLIDKHKED